MRLETKQKTGSGSGLARTERTGTYSKSGTTILVTQTNHGYIAGQAVSLNFTSGSYTGSRYYKVAAVTNANVFSITEFLDTDNEWKTLPSSTTSGNVTLDHGGTAVAFDSEFVDVQSITVTANGTTPRIAIYDFFDAPNPKAFKVLLYATNGTRVGDESGTNFSWSSRGN